MKMCVPILIYDSIIFDYVVVVVLLFCVHG